MLVIKDNLWTKYNSDIDILIITSEYTFNHPFSNPHSTINSVENLSTLVTLTTTINENRNKQSKMNENYDPMRSVGRDLG